MADAAASFRQQRANRLLTLLAVGKYADAAFECCAATVSPLLLQQNTQAQFAAGGTIAWVEPLQITPQLPPMISTGLCIRVCAVFQRYAFGRGQVIFDVGFGNDDRVFDIQPDPMGYHLVSVPKHLGSYWAIEQLPDPVALCRVRVDCHLVAHSKQVLSYPVPPHIENCQTNVSFKTWPEGLPVLAQGSSTEKVHMVVADANQNPTVTAEFSFNYARRVLTVKTPQPGFKQPIIHLHETLKKQCLAADNMVFNFQDLSFQQYLSSTGLRKAQNEDEVLFARRVHMYIAATMAYVPVSASSRTGGAVALAMQRETDSAGHAVLFVSILRANGIPARVSVGRWVSPDISPSYHCRAEFFADMVGWVPVETTEKGEALYFGSDAKAPFCVTSFGEHSTFRIQSSTTHAYGATLPPHVVLAWREPTFVYIAGNLTQLNANIEQWTSTIGDSNVSMPNMVGTAHQTPTTQKFSKAHESGPPVVGARSRPQSQSVSVTNTAIRHNGAPTATYHPPPAIPARHHAHSSVQVTTTGPPPLPQYNTQVPPPLPPHAGGPPALPPSNPGGYGAPGGYHTNSGPPALPPSNHGGYGAPPPALPPHQPGGYGPQGGHVNTMPFQPGAGGPPPLPQYNTQMPPPQQQYGGPPALPPANNYNQQPTYISGYGQGHPQQQGPPPQLPPSQGYQPQQGPPPQLPPSQGYQQQGPPPQLPPSQGYQQQNGGPPGYLQPGQQNLQQPPPQQTSPREWSNPVPLGVPVMLPTNGAVSPRGSVSAGTNGAGANAGASTGPSPRGSVSAGSGATNNAPATGKPAWPPASSANGETAPAGPAKAKGGVAKAWPPKQPSSAPSGPSGPAAGQPKTFTPGGPKKAPAPGGPVPAAGAPKKLPLPTPPPRGRVFAIAQFEHTPQDHLELPLAKGDIVEVLSEDDSGWWKAEKLGKTGIIPAPYVQKLSPGTRIAKAVFPFAGAEASDLPLEVGEFALIVASDGDWWDAEARGTKGSVPNNYIEEIKN